MLNIKANEFIPSDETLDKIKNEKLEFEKRMIKINKWLLDMIEEEIEEENNIEKFKNEFDEFDIEEEKENNFDEFKDFDEFENKEDDIKKEFDEKLKEEIIEKVIKDTIKEIKSTTYSEILKKNM
jgi:uncharacterized membrane protein YheB (UPF0754 family)